MAGKYADIFSLHNGYLFNGTHPCLLDKSLRQVMMEDDFIDQPQKEMWLEHLLDVIFVKSTRERSNILAYTQPASLGRI